MSKMKLLLVDDEERFLDTSRRLLEKKGYHVATANSGDAAIQALYTEPIHVVILDVKMPGKDGNAVLKEIKCKFPLVEVIMLTGHATIESAVDGLKSGATDYLTKPADMDELIRKAEDAYEKRMRMEEKIRMAEFAKSTKTPREILKQSAGRS